MMMSVYVVLRKSKYGERVDVVAVLDKEEMAELMVDVANMSESSMYEFDYAEWGVM